ncbi:MAG TPA: hypothetical protein VH088_22550 [Terriglobales bacterium]|jgi:hypothetical protein|nr:hypothetical protein [Terriglobales bacterium]
MTNLPLHDDAGAWTEAIAALRSLSAEVNAGFLALSQNDLQQFEARVAAQEKLCDSLRSSGLFSAEKLKMFAAEMKKAAASVRNANAPTPAQRLFEIQKELSHLNRVYSNLVGRGQELFSILIALQKGIRQEYSRQGKAVSADHTWSCEV